jgi:hypothetical protein
MDEVLGRVPSVHVESEDATILATRVAVEALQSHSVVIENSGVASQKVEYVVTRREEAERVHVKGGVGRGLEV